MKKNISDYGGAKINHFESLTILIGLMKEEIIK